MACAVAPSLPDTLADCARPPAHSQHHFTMPENSASSTARAESKISGIVWIMRMLCSRCTCLAQPVEAGVNQLAVTIMQQERKWATVDVEAVHDQERSRTCSCGVPEYPPLTLAQLDVLPFMLRAHHQEPGRCAAALAVRAPATRWHRCPACHSESAGLPLTVPPTPPRRAAIPWRGLSCRKSKRPCRSASSRRLPS
jgi:hypothetical protein